MMTLDGMTDADMRNAQRRDEEWFLTILAEHEWRRRVLRVGRFLPGDGTAYASARVICRPGLGPQPYVVWTLDLHDDEPHGPTFEPYAGRYCSTFERAAAILAELDGGRA